MNVCCRVAKRELKELYDLANVMYFEFTGSAKGRTVEMLVSNYFAKTLNVKTTNDHSGIDSAFSIHVRKLPPSPKNDTFIKNGYAVAEISKFNRAPNVSKKFI
jgi:hypothetical protein